MVSNILSRILVPYDGSKYSKNALDRAIEIAKKDESKIDIISVINVDYIRPPGALLGMVSPASINDIKRITASATKATAQMLASQVSKCRAKGIKSLLIVQF
jgi:nucleotide-binding universal stress UspA family protein